MLGFFAVAWVAGCASPYLVDRGRDAKDIFTATAGMGIGAKARVGPIQLPAILVADGIGLRGGEFFADDTLVALEFAQPFPIFHEENGPQVESRPWFSGFDSFDLSGISRTRGKNVHALAIGPFAYETGANSEDGRIRWHYYTQIEVCAALGLSVRCGFNAGELVDFILGWALVDICSDDLECRSAEDQPPQ